MLPEKKSIEADFELTIARRFLTWLAINGESYLIKDRPNPPDFVFSLGGKDSWLELTDIYLNNEQARFLNRPEEKRFSFFGSPDEPALRLFNKLNEKLSKPSYRDVFEKLGPGLLLLTCQDIAFDSVNLARIEEGLYSFCPFDDRGFFKSAYFEYKIDDQRVYRLVYPRDEAVGSSARSN